MTLLNTKIQYWFTFLDTIQVPVLCLNLRRGRRLRN